MMVAIGMPQMSRRLPGRVKHEASGRWRPDELRCGLRFVASRPRIAAVFASVRAWMTLACAVVVVFAVRASLRRASRRYLFPVHEVTVPIVDLRGIDTWALRASDHVPVHALYLAPPPNAPVVVTFHNNRSTAEDQLALARALAAHGLGVALVEYRGYGASRGYEPSEAGLFRDAEAVLDRLHDDGVGASRVVLLGTSLGTGVAAEMARRGQGRALVLVTPYTSIPDLVSDAVPIAPASQIVADAFDTNACAPSIRIPTLVIHGDQDEIVPFWMGRQLANRIAGARLIRVPGGRHGNLFALAGHMLVTEIAAMARSVGAASVDPERS
jgi:pimeloyl-ACP methyl ester carboxylesterase